MGIITFAGALAVMFMGAFAAPRGWKVWPEAPVQAYVWFLVGLAPILGVCVMWVRTGDQPVWAVRVVLCSILGAVGVITGLSITEAMYPVANAQPTQPTQSAPSVGSNNTVVNMTPPPSMGSGNTFVGPTDSNGATILNRGGVAIGAGAQADPTSIAIGAGAGGGSVSHPPSQKP